MNRLKKIVQSIRRSPLSGLFKAVYNLLCMAEYGRTVLLYRLKGGKYPTADEVKAVVENVSFFYKSFERQDMARRLYKSLQRYYPGVQVIVADDSSTPLTGMTYKGHSAEVVQLPFNSGLSYGLNEALKRVSTPYVVRMDDDELLTPFSRFHNHLRYLKEHPEIDMCCIQYVNAFGCKDPVACSHYAYPFDMKDAPLPLKLPHLTRLDESHLVVGKGNNCWLAKTDKVKEIGYDDRIRMNDHNEFFFRAAGRLLCVMDETACIYHYHNVFDKRYAKFRKDTKGDNEYIVQKHRKTEG